MTETHQNNSQLYKNYVNLYLRDGNKVTNFSHGTLTITQDKITFELSNFSKNFDKFCKFLPIFKANPVPDFVLDRTQIEDDKIEEQTYWYTDKHSNDYRRGYGINQYMIVIPMFNRKAFESAISQFMTV